MLLETCLIIGLIGIILICFYKQAVQEFRILQTDSLEKAVPLLQERSPIVVLPAPQPQQLWTRADCAQRPTLMGQAYNGIKLGQLISYESVALRPESGEKLAKQIGLPVWIQQTIVPAFQQSVWWGPLMSCRTEAMIGAQGLRQTYAYSTLLMATEGALAVSLINSVSDSYLPPKWKGKRLSKLTRDDAPLLAQIQYIDVIIRPGSALLIPPHWKVCWESFEEPKPALAVWVELHHPVSKFVRKAGER